MYHYLRHSHQPMQMRFDIRKARIKKTAVPGSANARPAYDSSVQVTITINKIQYGPYSTNIQTFHSVWDGRKSQRVSEASKALINELSAFQRLLESIHSDLLAKGEDITGDMIIKIAKKEADKEGITLPFVYAEFIKARGAMIEANRRQRKYDRIAEETFKSYPKRWAMIELFINQDRLKSTLIRSVNYAFTTRLKEYLTTCEYKKGKVYASATINKAISFLKMLVTYAQSKGYVEANVISSFSCRGGSPANPKPLSEEMLDFLENCELSPRLRLVCDSWLIAGELCFHYSDYMQLPKMKFTTIKGVTYVQNERSKQTGTSLVQTVNMTARAKRILAKYSDLTKLYYKTSGAFSSALNQIAFEKRLVDAEGNNIGLSFGQGRDSGLTSRARQGANGIQLSSMAGWSNPREARRYLGDALGIVAGFVERIDPETKDTH